MKLEMKEGKWYKTAGGHLAQIIGTSTVNENAFEVHHYLNDRDQPGVIYHNKNEGGKSNIHRSSLNYELLEEVEEIMEQKLKSLCDILATSVLPVKVRLTKSEFGGALLGVKRNFLVNEVIEITSVQNSQIQYDGGYIGDKSILAKSEYWEIVTSENVIPVPEVVKLTPEQEAKLETDKYAAQSIILENSMRLAIFSITMKKVEEKEVEKIVKLVYDAKKDKKMGVDQIKRFIKKTVKEVYEKTA